MLATVLNTFWSEYVWLPPNTTWADIAPGPEKDVIYTDHRHVFFPIPLALVFISLRYILDRIVFAPLGRNLGIKDTRPRRAPDNPKLEAAYKAGSKTSKEGLDVN
ncbi:unnamed protein product [Leptosia nina]|uniref:Uncharacterized protein n=1 Tax=Leptosia nina TaxID=320188 RepID=A0AAV1J0C3_9NEOP